MRSSIATGRARDRCCSNPTCGASHAGPIVRAARVHLPSCCGGGMAGRRSRSAARADPPRWRVDSFPGGQHARSGIFERLYAGAGAVRVGRGQEYPDRLPLCRERSSSLQDLCGGTGQPVTGRNSRNLLVGGRGAAAAAARSFGVTVTLAPVHDDAATEEAIAIQAREPGGGLICLPDTFNVSHRDVIVAAASSHGLPRSGSRT
jgi:hypothetical protein